MQNFLILRIKKYHCCKTLVSMSSSSFIQKAESFFQIQMHQRVFIYLLSRLKRLFKITEIESLLLMKLISTLHPNPPFHLQTNTITCSSFKQCPNHEH